jgi:Holliday junction DNA helicase RuvA
MIGSLRGTVLEILPPKVLLEVVSVGYMLSVPLASLSSVRAGEEMFFYIHDHIREDSHELYGFSSRDELNLFERMISISGVGPKIALAILSSGSADTVKRALINGDLAALTSIQGVGKKIAQKIILEMKGRIVETEIGVPGDVEVADALISLGYSAMQAKEALKAVPAEVVELSERIRAALKAADKSIS